MHECASILQEAIGRKKRDLKWPDVTSVQVLKKSQVTSIGLACEDPGIPLVIHDKKISSWWRET